MSVEKGIKTYSFFTFLQPFLKLSGVEGLHAFCDILVLIRFFVISQEAMIDRLLAENEEMRNTIIDMEAQIQSYKKMNEEVRISDKYKKNTCCEKGLIVCKHRISIHQHHWKRR